MTSITTLLALCGISHISDMVQSLLPHYWHSVTFPTTEAWLGQYDHITGTVWHFPHKCHDTASMTTLLAPCDLSHISGMVRPILPHYWHCVTIPTLVAWYGHYYHITGTVVAFPTLLAWHGQYYHITGTVWPFPTLVTWYSHYYHINGTVWHFPQQWHDSARMTTLLAPRGHFPHKWHDTASMTTLLAPCGISHISGMMRPVWPHYWHRVTFPTLVAWYGHYYHITGTVWHFPH